MKIGLFGGTFNPFHLGHIEISTHVLNVYHLDKLFFIPSAIPPHKLSTDLVPAQERYLMVKSSIKEDDKLEVSDMEFHREGPSYTIDTINEFKNEYGLSNDYYLLMGSDAFLDITTWKATEQLFFETNIIVMLRGKWKSTETIRSFIDENISKGYAFNSVNQSFTHKTRQQIIICKVPRIDISSTMIRERVKKGQSIHGLVPDSVEKMINTKELYL